MSEENADKALKEIKDALKKNTKQRTIPNPVISKIDDDEVGINARPAKKETHQITQSSYNYFSVSCNNETCSGRRGRYKH